MHEPMTLPRLHLPDVAEFRRHFEGPRRPVVLTGVMASWRALEWWSPEYFARHLGHLEVKAMTTDEPASEDAPLGPEQLKRTQVRRFRMRDFLQEVSTGPVRSYVSGVPLTSDLAVLLNDIELPEYREEGSSASPRLWLGRLVGPLHYDHSNNLHGIVYGAKRFTLFSPKQSRFLYPCSMLSFTPTMSRLSLRQADDERFPRWRRAEATVVDLTPGELLFIPAGWWHQDTTPTLTISIDFPWVKSPKLEWLVLRLFLWRQLVRFRGRLGAPRQRS